MNFWRPLKKEHAFRANFATISRSCHYYRKARSKIEALVQRQVLEMYLGPGSNRHGITTIGV